MRTRKSSDSKHKEVSKEAQKTVSRSAASSSGASSVKMTAGEKAMLRKTLVAMRERLTGQINALKDDSLTREPIDNTVEDGTDAFDRQLSLNLVSTNRDIIIDIDEAIRKLDEGRYGICEMCNAQIDKARIKALPFVKFCRTCQADSEKGRPKYRPLSPGTTM